MVVAKPQLAGRVEATPNGRLPFRVVFTETGQQRIIAVESVATRSEGERLIALALRHWRDESADKLNCDAVTGEAKPKRR